MATKGKDSTPKGKAGSLEQQSGFWAQNWRQALILLALPLLIYASAYRMGYVLDDKMVLSENKFVLEGVSGIPKLFGNEALVGYLGKDHGLVAGVRYRPLSLATFAIEHELFGVAPGMSHFLNVLLYALTALLIFRLFHLVLPATGNGKWFLQVHFLAALLFALHPIHTEVVANIKSRDEILALLLALAAAYYFLRGIKESKLALGGVSGVLFLLAVTAKENAITFLAVMPLLAIAFTKTSVKQLALFMVPAAVATGLYFMMRSAAVGMVLDGGQNVTDLMNNPFLGTTASQKSATISLTMAWYLKLLVFPHPLTHDYYPYHVPIVEWSDWRAIVGVVAHLGLLAVGLWSWRKHRLLAVAIGYYLLTIVVFSNILFPLGLFMNERFLFMPSVGFCLLLAWLLADALPNWFKGKEKTYVTAALAVVGAISLGYVVRTVTRVPDWASLDTLHASSIQVSPNSAYSNQYHGFSLYLEAEKIQDPTQKKVLLDKALPFIDRALEIYPAYGDALGTKLGILVGYFQIDNRIEPLLAWMDHVQKTHPLDYVDTVLADLIAYGQHRLEINYWLQEVGYNYFWVAKGDQPKARKYLKMLKSIDPVNPNVDLAIRNIETGKR